MSGVCGIAMHDYDDLKENKIVCVRYNDYSYALDKYRLLQVEIKQNRDKVEIIETYPDLNITNTLDTIRFITEIIIDSPTGLNLIDKMIVPQSNEGHLKHKLKLKSQTRKIKRSNGNDNNLPSLVRRIVYDNYTVIGGYPTAFPVDILCKYAYSPGYYNVAKFYNDNDPDHKNPMDIRNVLLLPYNDGIAMVFEGYFTPEPTKTTSQNLRQVIDVFSQDDLNNLQRILWLPQNYEAKTLNKSISLTLPKSTQNELYIIDLAKPKSLRKINLFCDFQVLVNQIGSTFILELKSLGKNKKQNSHGVRLRLSNHILVKMDLDPNTIVEIENAQDDEPNIELIKKITKCYGPESS